MTQTDPTAKLAVKLRKTHELTQSWPKTAARHKIVTLDGRPDPAMAWKIATQDYEPKEPEARQRYGLPAVCPSCHRKEPHTERSRSVPQWVKTGADFLERKLKEKKQ